MVLQVLPRRIAKSLAAGKAEEALYGSHDAVVVATGWIFDQIRKQHPNTKFSIRDGAFDFVRFVDVAVAGKRLFALNLSEDGGNPLGPEEMSEVSDAARVIGLETSNPAFWTAGLARGPEWQSRRWRRSWVPRPLSGVRNRWPDSFGEHLHFGRSKPEPCDIYWTGTSCQTG